MNSNEFKRWFASRQSVPPMHATELKTGTVEGIEKQPGLKGK